jgi:hypothetical protein
MANLRRSDTTVVYRKRRKVGQISLLNTTQKTKDQAHQR